MSVAVAVHVALAGAAGGGALEHVLVHGQDCERARGRDTLSTAKEDGGAPCEVCNLVGGWQLRAAAGRARRPQPNPAALPPTVAPASLGRKPTCPQSPRWFYDLPLRLLFAITASRLEVRTGLLLCPSEDRQLAVSSQASWGPGMGLRSQGR